MKIEFGSNISNVFNGNRVMLCNRLTGAWLKISTECYDYLKEADSEKKDEKEFLYEFENEDKIYMAQLIETLRKYNIINSRHTLDDKYRYQVSLCITNKCNLKCKHCVVIGNSPKEELDLGKNEMLSLIDKTLTLDPLLYTLTGGEPLCNPDFEKIVEHIRGNYDKDLVLMTNGTLIDNDNVEFIVNNFDAIDISIDGIDEATCSAIRGEGVFDKVLNSIVLLKENKFEKISLSMVIHKNSKQYYQEFMELNKTLGTECIFRVLAPSGQAEKNYDELFGDIDRIANFEEEVVSPATIGTSYNCQAIKSVLHIEADGSMYPCGAFALQEFCFGNVMEIENLREYLFNEQYINTKGYKALYGCYPENLEECKDCNIRELCISCPSYPYLYSKIGKFNEYCKIRKSAGVENVWLDEVDLS